MPCMTFFSPIFGLEKELDLAPKWIPWGSPESTSKKRKVCALEFPQQLLCIGKYKKYCACPYQNEPPNTSKMAPQMHQNEIRPAQSVIKVLMGRDEHPEHVWQFLTNRFARQTDIKNNILYVFVLWWSMGSPCCCPRLVVLLVEMSTITLCIFAPALHPA